MSICISCYGNLLEKVVIGRRDLKRREGVVSLKKNLNSAVLTTPFKGRRGGGK